MVSDAAWIEGTQIIADTSYMMFRELLLVVFVMFLIYMFKDIIVTLLRGKL